MFFFVAMHLAFLVLQQTDNLSRALQTSSLAAANVVRMADTVVEYVTSKRTEEEFKKFYAGVLLAKEKSGDSRDQLHA